MIFNINCINIITFYFNSKRKDIEVFVILLYKIN